MKEKALAASDVTLDTTSRTALNDDFKSLRDQIAKAVDQRRFNGGNMINVERHRRSRLWPTPTAPR